jgi:hypothetical protein
MRKRVSRKRRIKTKMETKVEKGVIVWLKVMLRKLKTFFSSCGMQ